MSLSGISTSEFQDNSRDLSSPRALVRQLSVWIFVAICVIGDFSIVAITALCARPLSRGDAAFSFANIAAAIVLGIACYLNYQQAQLYDSWILRDGLRAAGRIFARWSFLCLVILAWSVLRGGADGSKYRPVLLFYIAALVGFCLQRLILQYAVRYWIKRGNCIHRVVVIGDDEAANRIVAKLKLPSLGIHLSSVFFDSLSQADAATGLGSEQSSLELIAAEDIDTVIIAAPALAPTTLNAVLRLLQKHPLNVYATPDALSLPKISCAWARHGSLPGLDLVLLASCPKNKPELLAKYVIDRMLALAMLLIASPVMLVCAVGIMISDPGPVFFAQRRIGYRGREFSILKFRSMYVTPQPNTKLTALNDQRIFPFGRILRKTSLDELPQLFNVLRGDMSLVGPRPHMPQATAAGVLYFDAVRDYTARHRVKPGITGWAQVNGYRGPTETIDQIQSRVAHDLYYIENWSLVFDLMVLLKTALVLFGRNVF